MLAGNVQSSKPLGKMTDEGSVDQRADEDFAVPLCLWQRAAFLSLSPPGRDGSAVLPANSSSESDSLRLRIAQLNHEYWREISRGYQPLHVERLRRSLTEQYCTVMDSSEGVETIEAPVKVLTAGRKTESGLWKSELSVERVLAMPGVIATDRDQTVENLPVEYVPITAVSQGSRRNSCKTTSNKTSLYSQPPTTVHSTLVPKGRPSQPGQQKSSAQPSLRTENRAGQFPYCSPSTSGMIGNSRQSKRKEVVVVEDEEEDQEEEHTNGKWYGGKGRRRRVMKGGWQARKRAKREEEDQEEIEEPQKTVNSFITARDQHMLNIHKKHGGRVAAESGPQATSYGSSKKSLGTRRAPGSRFVPPVRRGEGEGGRGGSGEGGSSFMDTVRNKVQYGGGGDGGGGQLPPELLGDERLKNVEPRMVELIMNEIMDHGAPVEWDDIAGLQFAKATIKEIVVWPMLRPDIFTGLRGPPKGILLFGPPGTGKTLIGKCIASQVNATFFSISASSLTSKWIGEGEKMVRALFAVARCHQPAVIFMDEIDSLLCQRSESEHESSRRIKTEFLVQLDGATTSADDRILIIGATNRPQEIDEAARRRLVKRLYIPLPDGMARKQIVNNLLREQAYSLTEEELEELSKITDGYSGADMANLCREAAYGPIREAADTIQHISADEMRPVIFVDFQAALNVIRPSVSENDLQLYVQWNKQFGCGKH